MRKNKKQILVSFGLILFGIFLDQISKFAAVKYLKDKEAFPIIKDVFELKYLENSSAAFSLDPVTILHKIFHIQYFIDNPVAFLHAKMIFFTIITIIVVLLLLKLYPRIPFERHWLPMNLICMGIIAGSIGNLIDRILHQYVIDFLYFKLINFPIFNVADIYVTVSSFVLVFCVFFLYSEEDMKVLFPDKEKKRKQK